MVAVVFTCTPLDVAAMDGFSSSPANPQVVPSAKTKHFSIEAQSLGSALDRFSEQAQVSFASKTKNLSNLQSPGVSGTLAPQEALNRLLEGTGLGYQMKGNAFTLEKKSFQGRKELSLKRAEDESPYTLLAQNQGIDKNKDQSKQNSEKEKAKTPEKNKINLKPLNVIADRQRIVEGLNSYVVENATSSTKTDTPLIETPQSLSIVTRKQVQDQHAISLSEALRYTPGVQGEPNGIDQRLTWLRMRGFDATTTGLYRDGLQLRNPGFSIGYNIEPYSSERIEIPRGPASVMFGAGNPGGLINFVTKRPTEQPMHEFYIDGGSYNYIQGRFDISEPIEESDFSYRLTGLFRESDSQVNFTENDRIFIAPALTWSPNADTSLTILTNFQQDDLGVYQYLPAMGSLLPNPNGKIASDIYTGEPDVDHYDRKEFSLGYLFEHRINNTWKVNQNVRFNSTDVDDSTVFADTLMPDLRTMSRSQFDVDGKLDAIAIDNQVQAKFNTGPVEHTVLVGLDIQHVEASKTNRFGPAPSLDMFNPVYRTPFMSAPVFNISKIEQDQIGLYFQDQIKLFDRLIFQVGGRHDWTDSTNTVNFNAFAGSSVNMQDNDKFTFRGGVTYHSEIGLAPYFSYSESFLPVAGMDFSGNQFKPETGNQYEVGLKYQPPGWNSFITIAAFDLTRQNISTTDRINIGFQEQTGEANSKGIEFEAVSNLDFGLSFIASYTYLDTEITSSNVFGELGSRLFQASENTGSFWIDYTQPDGILKGLGVSGGVRYIGSYFADNTNMLLVPSVTLADAAIHYDWKQFRVALNAQNVFDKEFVACFDPSFCSSGPARQVRATVGVHW